LKLANPNFGEQWNLTVADVPDAWRFTRGSEDVLLVSIDSGIPISNGVATISDLSSNRVSFAGDADGNNHGHQSTSILVATPDNGQNIAGINWESPALVLDVYGPNNIGINTAINTALSHLDGISASRVVFQGGIQGEFWLNVLPPGRISNIADQALFAIAAGNGGQDIALTTSQPDGLSGGVARLEGVNENVIAVGALRPSGFQTNVGGQTNYSSFSRDPVSNFGDNLTLIAPTAVRPGLARVSSSQARTTKIKESRVRPRTTDRQACLSPCSADHHQPRSATVPIRTTAVQHF